MSGSWERRVGDIAELLVWTTYGQQPTLGGRRLICIDGPAGSGKTTLGRAVAKAAEELGTSRLLHMDNMYEGWGGLSGVSERVARDLVSPLAEGRSGRYQRYDWHRGVLAEWRTVDPVDLLVLEGVGSGAAAYDEQITTLVWVEAPRELRIERGIRRDGEAVRPKWMAWMADEEVVLKRERTRQRADVLVDGTGESDQAVVFV